MGTVLISFLHSFSRSPLKIALSLAYSFVTSDHVSSLAVSGYAGGQTAS